MAFPYDFGFVPSTRADDGDPVDCTRRRELTLMSYVRGYLVAGKRSDITSDKTRHDFRILNESLKNIDGILYDDLVENLETFLSRLKAS